MEPPSREPQSTESPSSSAFIADFVASVTGGIDLILCGVVITVFALLNGLLNNMFDFWNWATLPIGCALTLWGARRWLRFAVPDAEWTRRAQAAAFFAAASLALSPFVIWWREYPRNNYFGVNTLAFIAAFIATVFNVNRAMITQANRCGAATTAREATFVATLVLVGWGWPLVAALGFVFRIGLASGDPASWVLRKFLGEASIGLPRWILSGLALVPVAMTSLVLVKVRRLIARSQQPISPATKMENSADDEKKTSVGLEQ